MTIVKHYPAFSVLMSVYKKEKPQYLDLALKSIEDQTVRPQEIILVEDGPISFELKKTIAKHKKIFGNNFKVIISKRNLGLGAALKLGTKYVTTEWIARMDSDDFSIPKRFELQLRAIVDQPDLGIIGGQIKEFSSSINNVVGERKVPTSEDKIRTFVKWRSPFNHPTVMINKNILKQAGGYVPFGNLEDYYLWSRILSTRARVANLNTNLVYMRVDNGMYKRRGNLNNLVYILRLRKSLYKNGLVDWPEEIFGNIMMISNLFLSPKLRKLIYQYILHNSGGSNDNARHS